MFEQIYYTDVMPSGNLCKSFWFFALGNFYVLMQHLFGWPSCLDHPTVGQKSLVLLGINVKSQRFSVNLFFDTDSLWYVIWNRFRFCLYFTYMTDSFWEKEKEGRASTTMFVVNVDIEEYIKSHIVTYIVIWFTSKWTIIVCKLYRNTVT